MNTPVLHDFYVVRLTGPNGVTETWTADTYAGAFIPAYTVLRAIAAAGGQGVVTIAEYRNNERGCWGEGAPLATASTMSELRRQDPRFASTASPMNVRTPR